MEKKMCRNCYSVVVPIERGGEYRCGYDLSHVQPGGCCDKWSLHFLAPRKNEVERKADKKKKRRKS